MTRGFDIAVIGGGLVGAAIAYGLSPLGGRLCVLDEGDVALRAARGNFGLVWVQGKGLGMPGYGAWTQASAREWPALAASLRERTGIDVALSQPGGLHACLSRDDLDRRMEALERLFAQDGFPRYEVEALDRAALAKRLPGIGPDVVGGTWSSLDGHCNPLKLLRAFHHALARAGVEVRRGAPVRAIERAGNDWRIVRGDESIVAQRVVLCAGLGSGALAPALGLVAPFHPNKGHIVVLERTAPLLPFPLETIRQTDEGTILLGDSQQDGAADTALDLPVVAVIAQRATRVLPALASVRVNRAWAALRVMSPDGFPIVDGRADGTAFVVGCHSGVTLAAIHARTLAPALAAGSLPPECAPFAARRFDVRAAA